MAIDDFDAYLQERDAQKNDESVAATMNLFTSLDKNPDTEAKRIKLGQSVGVEPALIDDAQIPQYEQQQVMQSRPVTLMASHPATQSFLSNPQNSLISTDGVGGLQKVDRQGQSFFAQVKNNLKYVERQFRSGVTGQQLSRMQAERPVGAATPEEWGMEMQQDIAQQEREDMNLIGRLTGEAARIFGQVAEMTAGAKEEMVLGAAGGAGIGAVVSAPTGGLASPLTVPAGTAAGAFAGLSVGAYREAALALKGELKAQLEKERGENGEMHTPETVENISDVYGLSAGLLEVGPWAYLAKPFKKAIAKSMGKEVVKQVSRRGAWMSALGYVEKAKTGEALTEGAQNALSDVMSNFAHGLSSGKFKDKTAEEIGVDAARAFVDTYVAMTLVPIPGAALSFRSDIGQVQNTERLRDTVLSMGKAARESVVFQRLPEKQREFVEKMVEKYGVDGEVNTVKMDSADLLTQIRRMDNSADVIAKLGLTQQQIDEAEQTNSELSVSLPAFVDAFHAAENFEDVVNSSRFGSMEMSFNEQKQAQQEYQERLDEILFQAQQTLEQQRTEDATVQQVYDEYYNQAVAAGRPSAEAKQVATIFASHYRALGAMTNQDAMSAYLGADVTGKQSRLTLRYGMAENGADFSENEIAGIEADIIEQNMKSAEKNVVDGFKVDATISANTVEGQWYMDKGITSAEAVAALRAHQKGKSLTEKQQVVVDLWREYQDELRQEVVPFQRIWGDVNEEGQRQGQGRQGMLKQSVDGGVLSEYPALSESHPLTRSFASAFISERDAALRAAGIRVMTKAFPDPRNPQRMLIVSKIKSGDNAEVIVGRVVNQRNIYLSKVKNTTKDDLGEGGIPSKVLDTFYKAESDVIKKNQMVATVVLAHDTTKNLYKKHYPEFDVDGKGWYRYDYKVDEKIKLSPGKGLQDAYENRDRWFKQQRSIPELETLSESFHGRIGRSEPQDAGMGGNVGQDDGRNRSDNSGLTDRLFQQDPSEFARGYYGRATRTIGFLSKANASTALHELGHLWLDEMAYLSSQESSPQWLKDDYQRVRDWWKSNTESVVRDANFQLQELAKEKGVSPSALLQSAWHGSPHKFDKFTTEKIGTGEGAQAYGYGLYMASSRDVAEYYRDNLSRNGRGEASLAGVVPTAPNKGLSDVAWSDTKNLSKLLISDSGVTQSFGELDIIRRSDVLTMMRRLIQEDQILDTVVRLIPVEVVNNLSGKEYATDYLLKNPTMLIYLLSSDTDNLVSGHVESMNVLASAVTLAAAKVHTGLGRFDVTPSDFLAADGTIHKIHPKSVSSKIPLPSEFVKGRLYKVELAPSEDEYLLWDKPLSEQSEKVKAALAGSKYAKLIDAINRVQNGERAKNVAMDTGLNSLDLMSGLGGNFYEMVSSKSKSDKSASEYLHSLGIRGIKYLDGTSRADDQGNYNYVIFSDEDVEIKEMFQRESEQQVSLDAITAPDVVSWLDTGTTGNRYKDEAIRVATHEQFADGFLNYLETGKAPTAELQSVFQRFKTWLKRLFRDAQIAKIPMSDEIRGVFDRMLATEEEITIARGRSGLVDELKARLGGDTSTIAQLEQDAAARAEEILMAARMAELKKLRGERRKEVMAQVEDEAKTMPVFIAMKALKDGVDYLGNETPIKMNAAEVKSLGVVPKEFRFMTATDGMPIDSVAAMFGFESGDQMVQQMRDNPSLRKYVKQETDKRMMDEFGLDADEIRTLATKAVHNDKYLLMLYEEFKAVTDKAFSQGQKAEGKERRASMKVSPVSLYRETARQMLQNQTIGEIRPYIYLRAEAKSARQMGDAVRKGDWTAARAFQEQRMLNHLLYTESLKMQEAIDKRIKKYEKIMSRADDSLAGSRDVNMVYAARAILSGYGFGTEKMKESAAAYLDKVKTYDPDTYADLSAGIAGAMSEGKNYKDLTIAEWNGLSDAIDNIWELSLRAQQLRIDGKLVSKADALAELTTRAARLKKKFVVDNRTSTDADRKMLAWRKAWSSLRRAIPWVRAMDGGDTGPFRKYILNPVVDGVDQYREEKNKRMKQYLALLEPIRKGLSDKKIYSKELNFTFEGGKIELLHALMHTGNSGNKEKLLLGYKLATVNETTGEIDTARWDAFIAEKMRDGTITKADMDFVQGVWDLLEDIKPEAQKAHKDIFGYYFSEITAEPVQTPWGAYRGGYVPAITDPTTVAEASLRADKAAIEDAPNSFMFPTTGRGFTFKRVAGYNKPLLLDLGLIPQHIDKVLRFAYIEPRVKDAAKLVTDPLLSAQLEQVSPGARSTILIPWLQRSAKQITEMPIATDGFFKTYAPWARRFRKATSANKMIGNVANVMQQLTGVFQSATQVKPSYLIGSFIQYMSSPMVTTEFIHEKSIYMKNRQAAQMFEISSAIDDITLKKSKIDNVQEFVEKHGYFLQQTTQNFVDTVTWAGAYRQFVDAHPEMSGAELEKAAAREADSVVKETQGGFEAETISQFEAGNAWQKLFFMFFGYFNMMANNLGTQFAIAARQGGFKGSARSFYLYAMGFAAPAIVGELIMQTMRGQLLDDDDEDGYLDEIMALIFGSQLRQLTAMVPVVGQAVNFGVGKFTPERYDDNIQVSPVIKTLESAGNAVFSSVPKAIQDERVSKKAVKDSLSLIGLTTGLPVEMVGRPVGYVLDVEQGKVEEPQNALDAARGLIQGTGRRQ